MTTWTRVAIHTQHARGTTTEHWTASTYQEARGDVARYIRDNGLSRIAYSDTEALFGSDGAQVGHYTIYRTV